MVSGEIHIKSIIFSEVYIIILGLAVASSEAKRSPQEENKSIMARLSHGGCYINMRNPKTKYRHQSLIDK